MANQSPNGIPNTNNSVTSITRKGQTEPFDLQVSRGQIYGHSSLTIFGYNTNITATTSPQATPAPIWENAAAYVYPTTATTMTVVSTSTSDVCNMLISGLDANFNSISEVIRVNGTTGVTTAKSYLRINNLSLLTAPSGYITNQGTITVKQSTNVVAQINVGIGKSQSTIYTVPAGSSFYLEIVEVNTDNGYGGSNMYYQVQAINNATGVETTILQQAFTSIYTIYRSQVPFLYSEKTDLQWQVGTSNSSAVQVGVIIAGKLISNGN